jgi:peptide subunit release factor 1 (eRF1)
MVNEAAELSLDALIKRLSSIPVSSDNSILSVYLQSHGQNHEQRKQVRVFLEQMMRSKEFTSLKSRSREWKDKVQTIAKQADSFLNEKEKGCFRGIAFFAIEGESEVLSYASYLPIPNDYYILDLPALGPLVALREDYEPLCICAFNQEEAHILQLKEGILVNQRQFEQDAWPHHKQGGWAQARFQRKHDQDVGHFFKDIIHELEQIAVRNSNIKFALMGQRNELPLLRKVLPDQVMRRLIGEEVVARFNSDELVRRGSEILRRYEDNLKNDDLEKLSFGRISQGYGSINREKVFRAINQGQVDTLLVRRNLREFGAIVLSTHTILDKFKQESPYNGEMVSIAPLREILVYETIRHKGKIQWLSESPNGDSPGFGVLYRSRGSVDFTGN